jgi:hypothetical protein
MKEKVAFSIGTGVVLLGVALVASGVAQVQKGPRWEIPVEAATNWILFGLVSIVLYAVGIICYLRGNGFRSLSPHSRKIFWILLRIGLLMTVSSFLLDPGQWQVRHRTLSAAVRMSAIPISGDLRSRLDITDCSDSADSLRGPITSTSGNEQLARSARLAGC